MDTPKCSVPGCQNEAAVKLVKPVPGKDSYPYLCATHCEAPYRDKPLGAEYHFLGQ
jgi:hypothetical protein